MKISTLLESHDYLLEQHMRRSHVILEESCDGLTTEQRRVVEGIYNELKPLIEASLTADQIKGLFGAVEKQAVASGGSRTAVGKGVDVAKKANEIINNVGKWLADTTPVKMADQKFEQLKSKVGSKFPELDKQLTGLGSWMKENPGKSAAVIGVLTALASLAGGPVGGAIAGQVLRGAAELIKGEKLSTAIGKGIKTAVLGYLTGALADKVGSWLSGLRAEAVPFDDGLTQISFKGSSTMSGPGFEWTRKFDLKNMVVMPEDKETVQALIKAVNDGQPGAFDDLYNLAKEIRSPDYKAAMAGISDAAKEWAVQNDAAFQALEAARKGITAAAQGAVAASGEGGKDQKKENYYVQDRPLSEGQVYLLFNNIDQQQDLVMEGPLGSLAKVAGGKIAAGAKAVGGAVAGAAGWAGKQATEKITSAKLLASWKIEGSPTDSEELAKFLKGQGVGDDIVKQVYTDMKLPAPGSAKAAASLQSVKDMIAKLPTDRKVRLVKYMTNQLKVA